MRRCVGICASMPSTKLSVAAFHFFFVPPYLTFAVSDVECVITFAIMLLVGLMISTLSALERHQAALEGDRHGLGAALHAELGEDPADVGFDRVLGEVELRGDRLIARAGHQQA
jgi:two-component system, OmpR family, sensor histidine kinase KdpD